MQNVKVVRRTSKQPITFRFYILYFIFCIFLASCSIQKQISRSAKQVITDSSLRTAHVGISIYEPATGKYLYNYNADKYFVPASNTKIPTCYAAMKYLGDSLTGLYYQKAKDDLLYIRPAADPSFLHPDFSYQPVLDFFKKQRQGTNYVFKWPSVWQDNGLGSGWAWSDYMETYMAERSPLPMYGNVIKFKRVAGSKFPYKLEGYPKMNGVTGNIPETDKLIIERELGTNRFIVKPSNRKFDSTTLTIGEMSDFYQVKSMLAMEIAGDYYPLSNHIKNEEDTSAEMKAVWTAIKTQPTDSLLKPMMHRSDNFFAEQSLLMVSDRLLGIMNDDRIIDTLLATDLKDLPQKPRWADGSGLSRYNLFTPLDLVFILTRMEKEFGMERIKTILPTGGEGTITSYYKTEIGFIYAKTGTLSGVVALSGFLYTQKGKLLVFSVLVNNHSSSATAIRRSVEKFIRSVRQLN